MADLKGSEVEMVEFAFNLYGDEKAGKMDSTLLGKLLRACNLNPSNAELTKYGVAEKEGQKQFTLEECLKFYSDSKRDKKEQGCYEDFVECLKLYDKNENGKMMAAELSHSLLSLGEKLTDAQVEEVFEDCLPEENDDGEIEYDIFLRKMCGKPVQ
ncbi:myosin light chain alkali-like isoform X2 [Onthophagus taurus]|uniref:myosin light chain alkali-like isoform X2 n=1 Tax=Onthophagus taurus TaxID=166361 RepID=UPI000C20CB52|nr:myosin light chain alkali-like isoform X2 [Onthophagus taurus]